MAGVALVATWIAVAPILKNGFINWDDNHHIFLNPQFEKPFSQAIAHFFGPNYFVGNYIPLTMTFFLLQFKVGGLDPGFYHTTSIVLHLLNTLLTFLFVYRLTGNLTVVAAAVALFFGIHPMHIESVAWASAQKDLLFTGFFLGGLIVYLWYLSGKEKKHLGLLALSFALFVLANLAKPAAVVFPAVLLLVDYFRERRFTFRVWLEKLPFAIVSIVIGVVTIHAQAEDGLLRDIYPFGDRVMFASYALVVYIIKLFVPFHLSIFHPYPVSSEGRFPSQVVLSVVPAVLFLAATGWAIWRNKRPLAFGLLFFLFNVVLVLQLVSVGDAILAERYTYLAYTGLIFAGAWYANAWWKHRQKVAIAAAVFAAVFVLVARNRCTAWKTDSTIANDLVIKYPDDWLALNNKGFSLYDVKQYSEAIPFFQRALAVKPDYTRATVNLANIHLTEGRPEMAAAVADTALRYTPNNENLYEIKGLALSQRGMYREAIALYEEFLGKNPGKYSLLFRLAENYYFAKEYDKSLSTLEQLLKKEPNNHGVMNSMGYLWFVKGDFDKAGEYYRAALREQPGFQTAVANLKDLEKARAEKKQ